jgi:hypothetical protein
MRTIAPDPDAHWGYHGTMRSFAAFFVTFMLTACGGADNPQPIPSETEVVYSALIAACRDGEKRVPQLSDWPGVLDEISYENDGSAVFFALAAEFAAANPAGPVPQTVEEFIAAMNTSDAVAEADARLTPAELKEALAGTTKYAEAFARLRLFDSLVVLAPTEGWTHARDLATAGLLDCLGRRHRLLLLAGEAKQAEDELVDYLEVLQRLDRDSCLRARMIFNGELVRVLLQLVDGWLQPLAVAARVSAALEPLAEFGSIGRQRAWLRELKRTCWHWLQVPKQQVLNDFQSKPQELRRRLGDLRNDIALADRFELNAPDLLDPKDFLAAIAVSNEDHYRRNLAEIGWQEARLHASWLAFRLYLENKRESLQGRHETISEFATKFKATTVWHEHNVIQVGVDPKFAASQVLGRAEFIPVATIWVER